MNVIRNKYINSRGGTRRIESSFFIRTFCVCLLIVFVLLLSASVVSYNAFAGYTERQIGEESVENAKNLASKMTLLTDSLSRDAMHLSMLISQTKQNEASQKAKFSASVSNILFLRELYDTLITLVRANPYFASIYLYLEKSEYVISSESEYADIADFSDTAWLDEYRESGAEFSIWLPTRIINPLSFAVSDTINTKKRVMTYIYPLSNYITPSLKGLVVFNINESAISQLLNVTGSSSGERAIILTQSGDIISDPLFYRIGLNISGYDGIAEMLGKFTDGQSDSGYTTTSLDDDNVLLSYCRAGLNDSWLIVRFSDMNRLYNLVYSNGRVLMISMALIFAVSTVAVWFMTKRLSLPIMEIRERLQADPRFRLVGKSPARRTGLGRISLRRLFHPNADKPPVSSDSAASPASSDIVQIDKALRYLMREESRLSRELNQRVDERRKLYMRELFVENRYGDASKVGDASSMDGSGGETAATPLTGGDPAMARLLNESANLTLLLSDDTNISKLRQYGDTDMYKYQELLAQMCEQALTAPPPGRCSGIKTSSLIMSADTLIVLHFAAVPEPEDVAHVHEVLREFISNASRSLGFPMTIGVSNLWTGEENAHASYTEAIDAARTKLLYGYERVIDYESVPHTDGKFFYPTACEKQLLAAVSSRSAADAERLVREFFAVIRARQDITVNNAMLIIHLFTGVLVRELNETALRQNINLPEAQRILDTVYFGCMFTLDEVEERLSTEISSAVKRLETTDTQPGTVFEKMMAYIHENYLHDISVENIADSLGISYSYTRKVFRENTDRNLLEYINMLRIDKAKEYLRDTELSISEISLKVGYNNEQSFTRYFKKYVDIIPSAYRRQAADETR